MSDRTQAASPELDATCVDEHADAPPEGHEEEPRACARCFRMMHRSAGTRKLLAHLHNFVRDAFNDLVHGRVFSGSNIVGAEGDEFKWAVQDPMGVLFSTSAIIRWALTNELLSSNSLNLNIREFCAAALMLVVKLKTEHNFYLHEDNMTAKIMQRFLVKGEEQYRSKPSELRQHVWLLEWEIIDKCPVHVLVEETPYSAFEWSVYEHYAREVADYEHANHDAIIDGELEAIAGYKDVKAACRKRSMHALGAGYFYYHAALLNTDSEVLEDMGKVATADEIGTALAAVCVAAHRIVDDERSAEEVFDQCSPVVLAVAREFVSNARVMNAFHTDGLRVGPHDPKINTQDLIDYHLVSPRVMNQLSCIIVGMTDQSLMVGD